MCARELEAGGEGVKKGERVGERESEIGEGQTSTNFTDLHHQFLKVQSKKREDPAS